MAIARKVRPHSAAVLRQSGPGARFLGSSLPKRRSCARSGAGPAIPAWPICGDTIRFLISQIGRIPGVNAPASVSPASSGCLTRAVLLNLFMPATPLPISNVEVSLRFRRAFEKRVTASRAIMAISMKPTEASLIGDCRAAARRKEMAMAGSVSACSSNECRPVGASGSRRRKYLPM